ncbi:MAG: DUF1292 domain-containing protein [Bacilli bacterium]|nr:DUF1292 domain-containing protein [Bacilli bacterium]
MQDNVNNRKIKIEKDGEIIECDILFTFDSEETNKSYIGYTDNSIASNGRKNIFISSYNPFDLTQKLENITDDRELSMFQDILKKFDEEANNDN